MCNMLNKKIIFFLFLSNFCFGSSNYQIKSIKTDKIFYNVILNDYEVYVSSNHGIFVVDPSGFDLKIYDKSVKGKIHPDLSKNLNGLKLNFIDSPVLIPEPYSRTVTDFAYKGKFLYVVSKGDLIIYESTAYEFYPFGSVRSISENSVGSYSGIFINEKKLKKPGYTDGQIKEFEETIFICYNGIAEFNDGQVKFLYNNDNSKFSSAKYGTILDIFLIGDSKYLAISSKGIYHYNYKSNSFNLIYSVEKKIIPIRNKIENRIQNNNEFHFIDNNKYLSIETKSLTAKVLYNNFKYKSLKTKVLYDNFKYKLTDIIECSNDGNIYYGISESNLLLKFKRSINGLELINSYPLISKPHTVADFRDLVFISSNNGLSILLKSTEEIFDNVISDEFNKSAVYKTKNKISFGSIHGVYKIDNITDFKKNLILQNSIQTNNQSYKNEILLIFLSLIITLIIYKSTGNKNSLNVDIVKEIKNFIKENLATVTLVNIQDKFDIDYNALNNLQEDFSPAKFIKQNRNIKARDMFIENQPVSKISLITGYSQSYLIKNKYKFLKITSTT